MLKFMLTPTNIILLSTYIFIIIVIFFEKKDPIKVLAWTLLLIYMPFIGFLLYVFFNARYIYTRKRNSKVISNVLNISKKIAQNEALLIEHDNSFLKNIPLSYKSLIKMNSIYGNSLLLKAKEIDIFTDGNKKFDSLFKDIDNAKDSIFIHYFIIRDDVLGNEFLERLSKKAKEGVKVYLLYDFYGNILTNRKIFKELINSGGIVKAFLPNILLWNYRNHRKIVIIDDTISYTGGMNVGIEYLGLHKKIKPWRDTHLRIIGNSSKELKKTFYLDWYYSFAEKLPDFDELLLTLKDSDYSKEDGTHSLQLVSSGPDSTEEEIKYGFIKMINSAKNTIYIQTPYFIPDAEFLLSLKMAHLSGVEVVIMIPKIADKFYVYLSTLSYVEEMLELGIKVYLYDGFIHSKMIVVDGFVSSIGSSNIDIRSFSLSFETNVFIYDSSIGNCANKIFEKDLKNSTKLTLDMLKTKNPISIFFKSIIRLFSPLF